MERLSPVLHPAEQLPEAPGHILQPVALRGIPNRRAIRVVLPLLVVASPLHGLSPELVCHKPAGQSEVLRPQESFTRACHLRNGRALHVSATAPCMVASPSLSDSTLGKTTYMSLYKCPPEDMSIVPLASRHARYS